jgi:Cu(I)/Ag(I) efflux system membrane fusion protein
MPSAAATAPTDDRVAVDVNAATIQELGIRLEVVGRQSLTQEARAVATIVPDESRISHVHTRVAGWVEQLDVNTTGEMVAVGQSLARIFSQELLSSQAEYLAARRNTAASGISSAVIASGRTRLTLLTIADLSRVWVLAEVPEANIPGIRVGTLARLDFPASGRQSFTARVDFVYPTLTDRTRTLRVRFSAANAGGSLRPGLYGTAAFESAGQVVITVPRDAVVDTGLQQHVFVASGDRFEPRAVTLGVQLADRVEVRSGLNEGERIVAAGVFLLDSESRLRATGGAGGHNHGAPTKPQDTPATPATNPHAGDDKAPVAPAVDPHAGHRPASANAPADKE